MTTHRSLPALTLIALAVLAGCSSLPADNARLAEARSDYRIAQDTPQVRELAPAELKQAGDALAKADASWAHKDSLADVDHWSYLARQRVAIAQEVAQQKTAEAAVANAQAGRDKMRLVARTNEADAAQRDAAAAQLLAQESQRQSDASKAQAEAAQRDAAAAQLLASQTLVQNGQLETQLKDMNAKKTERGMVITIGDVLFDTNKAELKSGGMRNVEKLGSFLKQFPLRKALVEGYTDSVGSESSNQILSDRRAGAVRTALVDMGVGRERVAMHGYGEAYPVGNNDSADGRQSNRRVEIVLSDDNGNIAPR